MRMRSTSLLEKLKTTTAAFSREPHKNAEEYRSKIPYLQDCISRAEERFFQNLDIVKAVYPTSKLSAVNLDFSPSEVVATAEQAWEEHKDFEKPWQADISKLKFEATPPRANFNDDVTADDQGGLSAVECNATETQPAFVLEMAGLESETFKSISPAAKPLGFDDAVWVSDSEDEEPSISTVTDHTGNHVTDHVISDGMSSHSIAERSDVVLEERPVLPVPDTTTGTSGQTDAAEVSLRNAEPELDQINSTHLQHSMTQEPCESMQTAVAGAAGAAGGTADGTAGGTDKASCSSLLISSDKIDKNESTAERSVTPMNAKDAVVRNLELKFGLNPKPFYPTHDQSDIHHMRKTKCESLWNGDITQEPLRNQTSKEKVEASKKLRKAERSTSTEDHHVEKFPHAAVKSKPKSGIGKKKTHSKEGLPSIRKISSPSKSKSSKRPPTTPTHLQLRSESAEAQKFYPGWLRSGRQSKQISCDESRPNMEELRPGNDAGRAELCNRAIGSSPPTVQNAAQMPPTSPRKCSARASTPAEQSSMAIAKARKIPEQDECYICLLPLKKRDRKKLDCPAGCDRWHLTCISIWVDQHHSYCPLCKTTVSPIKQVVLPNGFKLSEFPRLLDVYR